MSPSAAIRKDRSIPPAKGGGARAGRGSWILWVPFLLAALAYLPTLKNGFVWDDVNFISENPAAHQLGSLPQSLNRGYGWVPSGSTGPDASLYFRPLVTAANTVNWVTSGGQPWPFHLSNLLGHAAAAGLLTLLAFRLGLGAGTSCLLGTVFGLHPALSEAVAWISGRTDVFAGLFSLACLVFLVIWRQGPRARLGALRLPWAAALTLLLAFCAKESAAALLLLAPLLLLLPSAGDQPGQPGRQVGARLREQEAAWILLGLAVLVYAGLRLMVLKGNALGGHVPLPDRGSFPVRALIGGNLLLLYLLRILVPWPLVVEGPANLVPGRVPALTGTLGLLLLAAAVVLWIRWLRGRIRGSAGPATPLLLGTGLFLLGLLPVLQFISTGEVYGERFLYLPAAGLFLALGSLADPYLRRHARAVPVLAVLLAVPYLALLQIRLPAWKDDISLFSDAAQRRPGSARALANLGSAQMKLGQTAEAERNLSRAVALDPKDPWKHAQYGSLLVNLGKAEEGSVQLEAAWNAGARSKTLEKNLGIARTRQGRLDEAISLLSQASGLDPSDPAVYDALALAERKAGRLDDAQAHFQQSIRLDPARKGAWLNLISLLANDRRDMAQARSLAEQFIRQFPTAPEAAQLRGLGRP
jgi:protein O-mannosyl-transferase